MPAIILPRRWDNQPQAVFGVNRSSPLYRGLLSFSLPGNGVIDVMQRRPSFLTYGSARVVSGLGGRFADSSAVNSAFEVGADNIAPTEGTIAVITRLTAETPLTDGGIFTLSHSSDSAVDPYVAFSIKLGGDTTSNASLGMNLDGVLQSLSLSMGSAGTAGDKEFFCGRATNGAQSILHRRNGGNVSSNTASLAGVVTYGSGQRIIVGEDYRLASRTSARMSLVAAIWGRILSDAEVFEFERNPWHLIAPLPRRLWVSAENTPLRGTLGQFDQDLRIAAWF